jgi:predicted MPP superfamily phosphohydrolase
MPARERIVVCVLFTALVVVYSAEMFLLSSLALGKLRDQKSPALFCSKPALPIHSLAIIGIICFLYALFIEPYWLEVKIVPIRTEKLTRTGFRLVQISDLHCGKKPLIEKRLVELVNPLEPDIIVFTGDALKLGAPSALPVFKSTMKNLKARLAKFAVRGNVDIWHMPKLDFFGGTGFQVLDANSVQLQKNGETFYISGLSCEYPSALLHLLKDIPDNYFSIFLYHYPDLIEDLANLNVDLYLAGHTHGGQVVLPFYGAIITLSKFGKKYESGMYTVGDTTLYVNRGIGGHATRIRFLARPEITVFDIQPENSRPD